jgi:dihydrofolate synthase / folylpolyglutamate synthase
VNYPQAIAWLYETQYRGIKLGLEQIRRLLEALGFDGSRRRFIHIAGTNGKGSVCAMLDAVCRAQGIRTGLYTSPHLVSFRERIKLDGAMISEQEVADGLDKIREIIADWETHPTFFEITTALALHWFQRMNTDVVVLETGLGGRLDSTNVVTPLVSVLTPIDLDHQEYLGPTLAQIASEKAGIIKPGVPVVSAPQHQEVIEVLIKAAVARQTSILFVAKPLEQIPIGLAGSHQKLNAALALTALDVAGIGVSEAAIRTGLANISWPGRFQIIGENCVLDGAHNEAAANRLALTWREVFGAARATIILGILKDKDMPAICRALLPIAAGFIIVPVRSHRSSDPGEIRQILHTLDPAMPCGIASDFARALEIAKPAGNRILITGSLFLAGEALAFFDPDSRPPEIGPQ